MKQKTSILIIAIGLGAELALMIRSAVFKDFENVLILLLFVMVQAFILMEVYKND